jgi:hypothetical protein
MIEAPGIWDWRKRHSKHAELNHGRLRDFRGYVLPRWRAGYVRELVASDDAFQRNPQAAYATAWAFSYYLCETQPRDYCAYLKRSADRKMFSAYSAVERMADFESIFGAEWGLMEAKFLDFMERIY